MPAKRTGGRFTFDRSVRCTSHDFRIRIRRLDLRLISPRPQAIRMATLSVSEVEGRWGTLSFPEPACVFTLLSGKMWEKRRKSAAKPADPRK